MGEAGEDDVFEFGGLLLYGAADVGWQWPKRLTHQELMASM